jgi:aminoglycoside phosphotransferase (APT) family kinase protein
VYLLRGGSAGDVVAKRANRSTLATEYAIYGVLSTLRVASVRCLGFANEPDTEYAWLFTEHVQGSPYSGSDREHRTLAARWLASVHASAGDAGTALPSRDIGHYGRILAAVVGTIRGTRENPAFTTGDLSTLNAIVARCEAIAHHWGRANEIAAVLPPTLVHGGFGAKNVRVRDGAGGQVLAFDWEAGGWGTPAADLASVDLEAYHEELALPGVALDSVVRLGLLGRLLKSISAIPGEQRALASPWPQRVMAKMRVYERRIGEAQAALGWEG